MSFPIQGSVAFSESLSALPIPVSMKTSPSHKLAHFRTLHSASQTTRLAAP